MRDPGTDMLHRTLEGLEQGLSVRHIASFDLHCCSIDDDIQTVFAHPRVKAFDQVPVRDGERIVGVLEGSKRGCVGSVREEVRWLDDSLLVSANEPLATFVREAGDSDYRLVLDGIRVEGIVTRTDLLKLPVRMFVFALVTHLELVMTRVIRQRCEHEDEWLSLLPAGRKAKLEEKIEMYREQRLNAPALELTEFCDKVTVVRKLTGLGDRFNQDLGRIERLRNVVAHAGNYARTEEELSKFVDTLRSAEQWVTDLKGRIQSPQGTMAG